jgi:S-DNA-T family DNA segregation ATPase FtsK/SpoIIIE
MPRKRRHRDSEEASRYEYLKPRVASETKKSILAILLIGSAVILSLAAASMAGPAGDLLFTSLTKLFGWGYYLLPAVAFLVAVLFIFTREEQLMSITFVGACSFIVFGLGLIDLTFPEQGGWIGSIVGLLEKPFGFVAATVLTAMLIAVSLLVTFNASLRLKAQPKNRGGDVEEDATAEEPVSPQRKARPQAESDEAEEPEEEPEEVEEVTVAEPTRTPKASQKKIPAFDPKDYVAPPLSLLASHVEKPTSGDLRANANIIKRTLDSFGIPVEMGEINIGPKVTRYTLKPAEGVKLARITALGPDLALALAAHPIRIEAPIPGKSLVGIEVPNKAAAIVRLGSLMGYPEFSTSNLLAFPLGRDVSGEAIFVDIEKMPHLLVAGATGSGKSITIQSILISLLYKNSPGTLKLILIDPKRVELSIYEKIPHLVAPVITDPKKSVGVFRWAIDEMDRRYETLLAAGCRDIKSYMKEPRETPMPYIVIVVDEMADLMARYGKEIEGSIVRLAQMARATGIHLILSTQRPSVEVITGLIKANITARIALQVASQIDSRTILDSSGAEKLLGGGDLLFVSPEFSKPRRIQGAYISEDEIRAVTSFIKDKNEVPEEAASGALDAISSATTNHRDAVFDGYGEEQDGDDDDLLDEAVVVVREAQKASASLLQRRLKVGYARAARLLDIMESKGIIGPGEGAKPRDILISDDPAPMIPEENREQP